MSATASQHTTTLAYAPNSETSFEFAKRKRWQDLLIAELHTSHGLILSAGGKILFCSPSLAARFGWQSSELLNVDFTHLLDPEYQAYFQAAFNEAILEDHDTFELTVRLKHKKEPISNDRRTFSTNDDFFLSLKCTAVGHPIPQDFNKRSQSDGMQRRPPVCEFAVLLAMPHAPKTFETIHTMTDINTQIMRHVGRINELRDHLPTETLASLLNPGSGSRSISMYATSSLFTGHSALEGPKFSNSMDERGSSKRFEVPPSFRLPTEVSGSFQDVQPEDDDMDVDRIPFSYGPTNVTAFSFDNETTQPEEGSKKKKLKRSQSGIERHVCITCGRTDSPEWRKGPQGPKTLCNACGLRWAKQSRKKNDLAPHILPRNAQEA